MWQSVADHQVFGNEVLIEDGNDLTRSFLSLATRSSECVTLDSEIDWEKRHNNMKASSGFRSIGKYKVCSTSGNICSHRNNARISSSSEHIILVFSLMIQLFLIITFGEINVDCRMSHHPT
jgi:hypothetical protein